MYGNNNVEFILKFKTRMFNKRKTEKMPIFFQIKDFKFSSRMYVI